MYVVNASENTCKQVIKYSNTQYKFPLKVQNNVSFCYQYSLPEKVVQIFWLKRLMGKKNPRKILRGCSGK
ncbi:MAG: hypothetical protein CVU39_24385 [Chloroflexi bacterium HGW-Chloroflexi-10]|nr:MAG: hypothetical protein CVU39_24385 [Chloroflexi bacterium HGW-Chloroflexi-10]